MTFGARIRNSVRQHKNSLRSSGRGREGEVTAKNSWIVLAPHLTIWHLLFPRENIENHGYSFGSRQLWKIKNDLSQIIISFYCPQKIFFLDSNTFFFSKKILVVIDASSVLLLPVINPPLLSPTIPTIPSATSVTISVCDCCCCCCTTTAAATAHAQCLSLKSRIHLASSRTLQRPLLSTGLIAEIFFLLRAIRGMADNVSSMSVSSRRPFTSLQTLLRAALTRTRVIISCVKVLDKTNAECCDVCLTYPSTLY